MNKPLVIAIVFAGTIFLASLTAVIVMRPGSGGGGGSGATGMDQGSTRGGASDAAPVAANLPDPRYTDFSIPAFSFTNEDGQTVTNDAFKGKVTIVNFIFTNCPLICPEMTGTTSVIADNLKNEPKVQFFSFTVDPEHDTPARLKEFAGLFNADLTRWQFVRGKKDAVWSIVRDGLKFAIKQDESLDVTLPDGSKMANIVHPSKLVLVGPDGRVLSMYYFRDEQDLKALEARARAVAATIR